MMQTDKQTPPEFFCVGYMPEVMLADLIHVFNIPSRRAFKLTQMAIDAERRLPPPPMKPNTWRYRSRCFTREGNPSDLAYRAEEQGSTPKEIYYILLRALRSDWALNWEIEQAANLHGDA